MIGQLVAAVREAKSEKQKLEILRANKSPAMLAVLLVNYGVTPFSAIKKVSYKPSGFNDRDAVKRLVSVHKTFYIFQREEGDRDAITRLFNNTLAQLTADEAKILADAHKGKLTMGLSVEKLAEVYEQLNAVPKDPAPSTKPKGKKTETAKEKASPEENADETVVNEDAVVVPPIPEENVDGEVAETTDEERDAEELAELQRQIDAEEAEKSKEADKA